MMWLGIGIDKIQHLIAGFVAVSVTVIWLSAKHASIISIAIAVGKEAYDAPTSGDADLMDFLATIFGNFHWSANSFNHQGNLKNHYWT